MGGRSHDFWCPNCKSYWSPFFWDQCPECGDEGIYDLNGEMMEQFIKEYPITLIRRGYASKTEPVEWSLEIGDSGAVCSLSLPPNIDAPHAFLCIFDQLMHQNDGVAYG